MFENVDRALEMGIPREYATLLIPNAINIRVIEGGDLFDWIHRWKQRLCYLAQEEIFCFTRSSKRFGESNARNKTNANGPLWN